MKTIDPTQATVDRDGSILLPDCDLLADLRNGVWLHAQEFPPLRYAVPGIVPEGSTLLVGPPKIGKSWFVLALGLAVASGGRMLGIPVGPARPVLLLALEDGNRRLQDRCRTLLHGDPIPARFQYLTRVTPGAVAETIGVWLQVQSADGVVIVDTLGKVMPSALPGESAYQRDYRIGSLLKRLADDHPGLSLLVNHHDRKAGAEDFVDAVSGTHGLAGAADTVIVLTRPRTEDHGVLKVTGRDIPEGEYAVRLVDGSLWTLDGANLDESAARVRKAQATAGLGDRSAEIVALVAEHPEGISPAAVALELDMDNQAAGKYLGRLAAAGRISRVGRGTYAPIPLGKSVQVGKALHPPFPTLPTFDRGSGHDNRGDTSTGRDGPP